jgi:hypothetical protein
MYGLEDVSIVPERAKHPVAMETKGYRCFL